MGPRGRYAPSPTGELHLGNASTALVAWLSVRAQGGRFVLRTEDLDRNRVVAELDAAIRHDLRWLGLDWEEGPDVGGPHEPYTQWQRRDLYLDALDRLKRRDLVYPCFCSRRDIAAAASAPQAPGDELRYPGTCRDIAPGPALDRVAKGERHAWRFRVDPAARPRFVDLAHGRVDPTDGEAPGDFVVHRADGVPAYQLAVVVDDAAMGIDEVVRGDDLLASTGKQLLLYEALGSAPPRFGHVPLLLGRDGIRLSKRHRGVTVREMREAGWSAEQLVGRIAALLGLQREPAPCTPRGLVERFRWDSLRPAPQGVVVDAARWERG